MAIRVFLTETYFHIWCRKKSIEYLLDKYGDDKYGGTSTYLYRHI